jgi:hypothetical protein
VTRQRKGGRWVKVATATGSAGHLLAGHLAAYVKDKSECISEYSPVRVVVRKWRPAKPRTGKKGVSL